MDNPLVSVIIPTYMGAQYLGEAIDSVLAQSYPNYEIIVVNDGSPDQTGDVIAAYSDLRLRYIVHETNRGAGQARRTAALASKGDIFALLDQDDYYHPDKLALHVKHYANDPNLGASYCGRFDLNPSTNTVRDIWRFPHPVTLADLVLGFPIAPTDLTIRREWFLRPDILDGPSVFHGGEIIRYGKLYLANCKFAPVERALSYHRYHAERVQRNIERDCSQYLFAQNAIFDDERCPEVVRALRPRAHTMSYLVWAAYALKQSETAIAHKLLRQAASETPDLAQGPKCQLAQFLMRFYLKNDYTDHEETLRNAYGQLPDELCFDGAQLERVVATGYLLRGTRSLIWERTELGEACFERARQLNARVDDAYLAGITHQLLNYGNEYGFAAMQGALGRLAHHLDKIGGRQTSAHLLARLTANRAFHNYRLQNYRDVLGDCVQTIANDPRYIANRGMVSVFMRSLTQLALHGSSNRGSY